MGIIHPFGVILLYQFIINNNGQPQTQFGNIRSTRLQIAGKKAIFDSIHLEVIGFAAIGVKVKPLKAVHFYGHISGEGLPCPDNLI